MHSVRVKRGQYSTLEDGSIQRNTRPRSRSLADVFGPPAPLTAPTLPRQQVQNHPRQRSETVSSPRTDEHPSTASPPRTLRRPSSKIHEHIMSSTRRDSTRRNRHYSEAQTSPLLGDGRRRSEDSSDVVSLRGSAENVEYRGDSRRMGRIGSALNFHEDGDDGLHHEDDIVEHLDVIGKFLQSHALRC